MEDQVIMGTKMCKRREKRENKGAPGALSRENDPKRGLEADCSGSSPLIVIQHDGTDGIVHARQFSPKNAGVSLLPEVPDDQDEHGSAPLPRSGRSPTDHLLTMLHGSVQRRFCGG